VSTPRILVAGVGNVFHRDDAFGVEVVRRLSERPLPEGVRVIDFGIRGFDLTYAFLDGYDAVILADTAPRGEAPGTVYLIEPDLSQPEEPSVERVVETHGMNPMKVLRLAVSMGAAPKRVFLVGCEPATLGGEENPEMEMSEPVAAAVDGAVALIESLLADLLSGGGLVKEEVS
jgi:hydrogenase maturation protease